MAERRALMVVYDDTCAFCRATAAWIERRSPRGRLHLVPVADVVVIRGLRLLRADLASEMHVVDEHGRVHRGFRAWRRVAREVTVLRPLLPLLWLPGAAPIGDRVYRRVAAHRAWLSRALGFDRRDRGCSCGIEGRIT